MVLEPTFDAAELFVLSGVVALVTVLSYLAFVVVAGKDRSEGPEPRGQAVYVHLVLLISMFVALFAATTVVAALAQLIGTNTASSIFPGNVTLPSSITGLTFPTAISGNTTGYVPLAPVLHPVGDAAARGVVAGTIVLIVAGLIFVTHWKQARHLADDGSPMTTNSRRARQAYLNTANFTAVLILIVSASLAGYKVFEAAAPGVALANDHVAPLRSLIPLLFITGLDLIIFQRHWRDQQRLRTEPESGMDGPSTDTGDVGTTA